MSDEFTTDRSQIDEYFARLFEKHQETVTRMDAILSGQHSTDEKIQALQEDIQDMNVKLTELHEAYTNGRPVRIRAVK